MLVFMYGLFGVGDGVYFGCFASVSCQVAGSANLSNQAIGYLHFFMALPVVSGKVFYHTL
jgi:hypothetical protein